MSGLIKAKKYDWKDSNLSLFGSDLERNVKKQSAETEAAWHSAGKNVGVQIWRVVKFKIESWPKEEYGKFYEGDSYIVLNTYKNEAEEELQYDVHFWIGKYSTQDEYGTAAYKTVELDTFLNDVPIQHREVQDHESDLFKSYFESISLLKGGAATGFRHVKPEEYKPRLLHFSGTRKSVVVREVPLAKSSLDSNDVFILDLGLEIYQWNGKGCNKDEKFKAVQFLQGLKSERGGKPKVESLDEASTPSTHKLYTFLPETSEEADSDKETEPSSVIRSLYRLSDATGKMTFELVKENDMSKADLDSKDVFILDNGKAAYVWIGQDTSANEQKSAMEFAHNYLMKTDHPLIPVSVIKEKQLSKEFDAAIAA